MVCAIYIEAMVLLSFRLKPWCELRSATPLLACPGS